MHCLFMRHGHTNYNLLGLCNDDPRVDVHLTSTGILQARQAAQALRSEKIDLIVTSELPRTRQTAMEINRFAQAPVVANNLLNDIRSGFDSRPVAEYFAAIAADPLNMGVNGGESLREHKERVLLYIDWLRQQTYNTILSIAHEETLRVFYAWQHDLPDSKLRSLHFRNCEVFRFELA
jgi:broad specificity phosphatase PhoE